MKKLLFILFALLISTTVSAQKFNAETKTFSKENTVKTSILKTKYKWEESDSIYPIYITTKGRTYIEKVSKKSGKVYRKYLPEEVSRQICTELNIVYVETKKEKNK